jgi:hypothetical protein
MSVTEKRLQSLACSLAAGILLTGLLGACVQRQVQPPPAPLTPDCPPCPMETITVLAEENQSLQHRLSSSNARIDELEDRAAQQEIRMLQKEALTNELQRRVISQQKQLDDAITEVVRTKAKLRSIESRAEAASTIAETEIALKTMRDRMADTDVEGAAALSKADALLKLSAKEFKAQNYGGALYLAVQSKSQVVAGDTTRRDMDEQVSLPGEVRFDQPLPLTLTKNTNLRKGPETTFNILATLKKDSAVVGYSHMGNWIRIETEDGKTGWVYHSLVMAR